VSDIVLDPRVAAELPELAPPPPPRRPRVLLVGSAVASVAWALAVLALIAIYLSARAETIATDGQWLPEEVTIPLSPGSMGLVTLLMSAVTMHWVVHALRNGDRTHAYLALGITGLLGAAFINGTYYLYTQTGLGIADSAQAVLFYAITGTHLAMVIAGLLFAAAMAFHALGGQLTGRSAEGMAAAALFWYVAIAVDAVVWLTVYVTK
jgi:heme/copper-type cytochrome/quinol oxidase subunit 3